MIQRQDYAILRELGQQVREVAELSIQQEKVQLWKELNGLRPVRPMVMIDQIPWHEMNVDDELTLKTSGEFARRIEDRLRKILYQWRHMPVDMVVEPNVPIPMAISGMGYGLNLQEERAVLDANNDVVGHHYIDQLQTEEDLEKLKIPVVCHDEEETNRRITSAQEVFDGILTVQPEGVSPMLNLWDTLVTLRGAQNAIFDLIDRPQFMHAIVRRMTDAALSMATQLEEQGLLVRNQPIIHCSGAYSHDLPSAGFNPSHPRTKDLWAAGTAQIFSTVSPQMHQEFELDYANDFYARFGLVYYGCCEPLDGKLDIVRRIPNLRKISMSPWVDLEKGAMGIGGDFVFSRKPNPAYLAGDAFDVGIVRQDILDTIEVCQRHGCPLEFILKDISTVRYQPQRLWQWADAVMKIVTE